MKEQQWQGLHSGVETESVVTARTAEEWQALWGRVGRDPPVPLPADRMALGIFLGQRPSGGYRVEVLSVVESRDAVVVSYRERRPTGPAITVLTYPYLVALVPRSDLPLRFVKKS